MILYCRAVLLITSFIALLIPIHGSAAQAQQGENGSSPSLDELRKAYKEAVARAANIPRPKFGTPGFKDKLSAWAKVQRQRTTAVHRFAGALLKTWKALPDDSRDLPTIEKEIKAIYQEETKPPLTEKSHKETQFFAGIIWKFVVPPVLSQKRALFLTSLTAPHRGIRANDRRANLNLPTEPWGWDIQDTYSIALLRAGRLKEARKENELLLKKLTVNLKRGRLPNVKVNFRGGKRTQMSLKREFLLHRSLIEVTAGEVRTAKAFLEAASTIDETKDVAAAQESIIKEIRLLIEQEDDGR